MVVMAVRGVGLGQLVSIAARGAGHSRDHAGVDELRQVAVRGRHGDAGALDHLVGRQWTVAGLEGGEDRSPMRGEPRPIAM